MKIKSISIQGIRGINDTLQLELNGKSILLYGDNGTGKSSITDSIEWFYTDKVSHLSSQEIDLKEALRNSFLNQSVASSVEIKIVNGLKEIQNTKSLSFKKEKLISDSSNKTPEYINYLNNSLKENLILRYNNIRDIIDKPKSERLKHISDLIGFSDVSKTKEILRKSLTAINQELKTQNYQVLINNEIENLFEKIGIKDCDEIRFITQIKKIIEPLKFDIIVNSINDVDKVLEELKRSTNTSKNLKLISLNEIRDTLLTIKNETAFIDSEYQKYFNEFNKISKDSQIKLLTKFRELLKSGENIISENFYSDDNCPLCLQEKNIKQLYTEIQIRLKEIEEMNSVMESFEQSRVNISEILKERLHRIDKVVTNPILKEKEFENIGFATRVIKEKLIKYQDATLQDATSGNTIPNKVSLMFKDEDFIFLEDIILKIQDINTELKNDKTTELFHKISVAKAAFQNISKFKKLKFILENQSISMEHIFNEFVKYQKEGLENFLNTFSTSINEFYQFMNPNEQFDEIKIITIGENDELNGITIQYKYKGKLVFPPQKYFSESHLNCIGISLFLSAVTAFNCENNFIIFDDVISSFDTTHRKRFADLLFSKFSKYQLIILTHETNWFNQIKSLAKDRGWECRSVKWSDSMGTYISEAILDKKQFIDNQIRNSRFDGLGNDIRSYLEFILKKVCINLEVKLIYKDNSDNENRMATELLNEIRSTIKKHAENDLKDYFSIFDRLSSSIIIANHLSHHSKLEPKSGDIIAIWKDIQEFEAIFFCQENQCSKNEVSLYNYDNVENLIRCRCGKTKYKWKK